MTQITQPNAQHAGEVVGRGRPRLWLAMLAVVSLLALRLVHLGADVPSDLSPESAGVYVDEGYKTIAPRNLAQFGTIQWNPRDEYRGWMTESPLTQWPFYVLFRLFGATVETARILPIACFTLLLVAYVLSRGRRYSPGLLIGGLFLLGLEPTLYFISRTALLETPLLFALYGAVFLLARDRSRGSSGELLFVVSIAIVAAFGIKKSAVVYFLPVIGAIVWVGWIHSDARSRVRFYTAATAASFGLALLLVLTHETWAPRIAFSPMQYVSQVFDNPTARVSFPVVLSGLLCVVHLLVTDEHLLFQDTYRASLAAIAVGGPMLLALFPYDPLRDHAPVLPAYVLLALEWIHARAWRCKPVTHWLSASAVAAVMLLVLWWVLAANALGQLLLGTIPFRLRYAIPVAAGLAASSWWFRERVLSGKRVATVLAAGLAAFALHTGGVLGDFMLHPGYEARSVRAGLVKSLPVGSTIAGDWAPFFALGTDFPALYVDTDGNPIERIQEIRPDFFLYSETEGPNAAMVVLREAKGVKLGKPVFEGHYNRSPIIVYPLEYDPPSDLE